MSNRRHRKQTPVFNRLVRRGLGIALLVAPLAYVFSVRGNEEKEMEADAIINFVMIELENMPDVISDGKGYSRFGINSAANPDVDVCTLTEDCAREIYRDRYWDAINADALPAGMRLIAFDGAVNQGVPTMKKMLKAADGDVCRLVDLRRAAYEKIGGKYLKGWLNRLDRVCAEAGFEKSPAPKQEKTRVAEKSPPPKKNKSKVL